MRSPSERSGTVCSRAQSRAIPTSNPSARSIRLLGFDLGFATARWVHRVSERIPWRCPFASAGRAFSLVRSVSNGRIVAYRSGHGWSETGRAAELSGLLEAVGKFEQHWLAPGRTEEGDPHRQAIDESRRHGHV